MSSRRNTNVISTEGGEAAAVERSLYLVLVLVVTLALVFVRHSERSEEPLYFAVAVAFAVVVAVAVVHVVASR